MYSVKPFIFRNTCVSKLSPSILKSSVLSGDYVICCRSSVCGVLRETVGTALRGTSFLRSKVYKWGLNCGPEVSLESVWKHNDCVSIEAAGAVAAGFAP